MFPLLAWWDYCGWSSYRLPGLRLEASLTLLLVWPKGRGDIRRSYPLILRKNTDYSISQFFFFWYSRLTLTENATILIWTMLPSKSSVNIIPISRSTTLISTMSNRVLFSWIFIRMVYRWIATFCCAIYSLRYWFHWVLVDDSPLWPRGGPRHQTRSLCFEKYSTFQNLLSQRTFMFRYNLKFALIRNFT